MPKAKSEISQKRNETKRCHTCTKHTQTHEGTDYKASSSDIIRAKFHISHMSSLQYWYYCLGGSMKQAVFVAK